MNMPADSHCHLNDPAFDQDRDEAIQRARDAGLSHMLNVGYDLATSRKGIELAEVFDNMYASVGVHPHNADALDDEAMARLREMGAHTSVVAIGETGLDYYRNISPRREQETAFRRHLALARELGKPVIVHCRDAMDDCIEILRQEKVWETGGVLHCFTSSAEDRDKLADMGMSVSFAGNVTYPRSAGLREVLESTPAHMLLLETDSPYLSPQKRRGKRNEPANIIALVELAASLRGISVDDMARISRVNFEILFRIGRADTGAVVYRIRNSLYVNVTKSCDNKCGFCGRFFTDTVQGHNLRLEQDPTANEMISAVGDPTAFDEIVFCGYGEPTLRLERIKQTAAAIKARGGKTRLNTNGHGSQLAKRDITLELVGLFDRISVSLNAPDERTYDRVCKPTIDGAWEATLEFIRSAKKRGIEVTATAVAIPGEVDIDATRRLAQTELGVKFRKREYNLLG